MAATPTLPQSIGQAETALRALLDSVLTKSGTTFLQWVTLSLIARNGSGVLQKDLVRQVAVARKVDEPTVLATLDELIGLGFIIAQPDDSARIELTGGW
jgi:DNA-binding MarR family transcriptional regulator